MATAVKERQQIDVFVNENGSITIEQHDWHSGDNPMVIVEVSDVDAVINALREAALEADE